MEELKKKILSALEDKNIKHKSLNHLATILSSMLKDSEEDTLSCLKELEREGEIFSFARNRYTTSKKLGLVKGKLSVTQNGYAFVINETKDIFIPKKDMAGAFDGDIVLCKVILPRKNARKSEGKIVRIIQRDSDDLVGTIYLEGKIRYILPDRKKVRVDVMGDTLGAKSGDKVVFDIVGYKSTSVVARVVEVIGSLKDKGNDIKWLLKQYKVKRDFDESTLKQARAIPQQVDRTRYSERRDLSGTTLFTIDGIDAKDLDDAVSIKAHSDGTYTLGVHIADVGEYVRLDTPLDKEAFDRGTSIYFLDQVIPMLPVELSNGICSLNEGVERLALSVIMHIDKEGEVIDSEIFESIINSKHRLNYDEVQMLLDGDKETRNRLKDIAHDLDAMHALSKILMARRRKMGSIDFDIPEGEVIVDADGRPIRIEKRCATDATKLIENFMVVANETVARTFEKMKVPFVYRVHERPDSEKMHTFYNFVENLGVSVHTSSEEVYPIDLQKILDSVKGDNVESVVNMVMLRSLKKARYFETCLGHFGMALDYYCHFTSPIRRYPDLCIHRIIKEYLHGNNSFIKSREMANFVSRASIQSSAREKVSEDVERAITDYKKVEYMERFIGEDFEGIISSVTPRGFYVELDNTCEGMVSLSSLKDDFYFYNEETLSLSSPSGNSYRIGEKVQVKVVSCNREMRRVDFEIIKKIKK